jgi:hypothetical protein
LKSLSCLQNLWHATGCVILCRNSALGLLEDSYDMRKDAMSKISLPAKTSGDCHAGGLGLVDTWVASLEAKGTWSDLLFLNSQGRLTEQSSVF